jgi:hypothetical protein
MVVEAKTTKIKIPIRRNLKETGNMGEKECCFNKENRFFFFNDTCSDSSFSVS